MKLVLPKLHKQITVSAPVFSSQKTNVTLRCYQSLMQLDNHIAAAEATTQLPLEVIYYATGLVQPRKMLMIQRFPY